MNAIMAYLAGLVVVCLAALTLVLLAMVVQCNVAEGSSNYAKGYHVTPTNRQWRV